MSVVRIRTEEEGVGGGGGNRGMQNCGYVTIY